MLDFDDLEKRLSLSNTSLSYEEAWFAITHWPEISQAFCSYCIGPKKKVIVDIGVSRSQKMKDVIAASAIAIPAALAFIGFSIYGIAAGSIALSIISFFTSIIVGLAAYLSIAVFGPRREENGILLNSAKMEEIASAAVGSRWRKGIDKAVVFKTTKKACMFKLYTCLSLVISSDDDPENFDLFD